MGESNPDNPMLLKALKAYPVSALRAFSSVSRVPLYINGKFIESKTDQFIPVHNPVHNRYPPKAFVDVSLFLGNTRDYFFCSSGH